MGLGKNQPFRPGPAGPGAEGASGASRRRSPGNRHRLDFPQPEAAPPGLFSDEALQSLAESIRQYGLIQPVVVQKKGGAYELIAGERRLRAAKLCGLTKIPAVVRDCAPQASAELALIENLQREDLDPVEEASAYRALIQEFGLTQEQAAEKVGRSRVHVSNMMRLLQLPEEIQQYLIDGVLSIGQARPLLQLKARQAPAGSGGPHYRPGAVGPSGRSTGPQPAQGRAAEGRAGARRLSGIHAGPDEDAFGHQCSHPPGPEQEEGENRDFLCLRRRI